MLQYQFTYQVIIKYSDTYEYLELKYDDALRGKGWRGRNKLNIWTGIFLSEKFIGIVFSHAYLSL